MKPLPNTRVLPLMQRGDPNSGYKQHIPLPMSQCHNQYLATTHVVLQETSSSQYPDDFGGVPAKLGADVLEIITLRPHIIQSCLVLSSCHDGRNMVSTHPFQHLFPTVVMYLAFCSTLGHSVRIYTVLGSYWQFIQRCLHSPHTILQ